jgi:UrcA family protein
MHTQLLPVSARSILAAITIVGTLFASTVAAAEHKVIVAIPVNARGLDLSQPAAAQQLYQRLDHAAYTACTRANRVGLAPSADVALCSEKALADTVRSVNLPLLTQAYLAKHTQAEALAHGIELPAELAAK